MHSAATHLLQHILDLLVYTCIQFVRAEDTCIAVAFLYKPKTECYLANNRGILGHMGKEFQ